MEIKPRAFPYPVLGPLSDDYTEGAVKLTETRAEAAPQRYTISFRYELTHPDIATMVASGDANPSVVIECRQNLYRVRHAVVIGANEIQIPADELSGHVQITPIVSATRDIPAYCPGFLSADYQGISIRMPKHGVIAYGINHEFIAEPQADRLRKISSIMRVVESDTAGENMKVNIDGARIRVEISPDQFRLYQNIAVSRQASQILASMLVLPVLIDVFHRVKENQEGLEDLRWFQVVRIRLAELKLSFDSPDFNPLHAAQRLLDAPFGRGINELIQRLGLDIP